MRQVILIPDPDGGYTVEVPSLPGCISEGDTLEEAIANIREARSESAEESESSTDNDFDAQTENRLSIRRQVEAIPA